MPQVNTNLTVLNLKLRHANVTQMSALPLILSIIEALELYNSSNPLKIYSKIFSKKNVVVTKLGLITRVPLHITMNLAV